MNPSSTLVEDRTGIAVDAIALLLDPDEKGGSFDDIRDAVTSLDAVLEATDSTIIREGLLRRWNKLDVEIDGYLPHARWLGDLKAVPPDLVREDFSIETEGNMLPYAVNKVYEDTFKSEPYCRYARFDWWHAEEVFEAEKIVTPWRESIRRELRALMLFLQVSIGNTAQNTSADHGFLDGFDAESTDIVKFLDQTHPKLKSLVEIHAATNISQKTVGTRITELIEGGLAHRPKGEKKGVTLTDTGRTVARTL